MENLAKFRLSDVAERTGGALVAFKTVELAVRALRDYHRHEVFGLENVPPRGSAILVFNHSLATYDGFLPVVPIYDELRRMPWALVDRLFFRVRSLGAFFHASRFVEGTRSASVELLERGELLCVTPGGMREALRTSRQKYRVDWKNRHGFVRISILSGAPIILCACPRADDIFTVYENPLTPRIYETLRVPLPLFRGMGPSLLPRPIKLVHTLSAPIPPPPGKENVTEEEELAHHALLERSMNELMQSALDGGR